MLSYKIYINEKPLFLIDDESLVKRKNINQKVLFYPYNNESDSFAPILSLLKKNVHIDKIYLYSKDFDRMVKDFETIYPIVEASGGLVRNEKNEFLFIFRRGNWDLPKGKLEKNESRREGAIREVIEETGIKKVKIIDKIGVTYHIFKNKKGKESIKKSHWYLMRSEKQKLVPQLEEDIEIAEWKTLNQFKNLSPAYNNIKDIIEKYEQG